MQEELADKENEFEIVDFVKYNFNASVGFERAPPPLSATERDDSEEAKQEEENEQVQILLEFGGLLRWPKKDDRNQPCKMTEFLLG